MPTERPAIERLHTVSRTLAVELQIASFERSPSYRIDDVWAVVRAVANTLANAGGAHRIQGWLSAIRAMDHQRTSDIGSFFG